MHLGFRGAGARPPRKYPGVFPQLCSSGSPEPERQDQAILPYREDEGSGTVARGPGPREASSRSLHGERQALALRYNERFFISVARGPGPRDVRWEEDILGPLGP